MQAVALYRERFAVKGMFENSVYPGIVEVLAELSDHGAWLSVATVKPTVFAERIVEHFGLGRFFHGIYGSELDGNNSDKTHLLGHLLKSESLSPSDTIMIGDRAHDVLAAKANDVSSIGVLWGYGSREELVSAGADALCENPATLPVLLTQAGMQVVRA